jgi:hypothetical protein
MVNKPDVGFVKTFRFSGTIPIDIFSELEGEIALDLGFNQFVGEIPTNFGSLTNLSELNVVSGVISFSFNDIGLTLSLPIAAYFVATENSFDEDSTDAIVCNNTKFIILDCSTCTCCDVCCEGEGDSNVCDIHMTAYGHLGLDCADWWMFCSDVTYDPLPVSS